MPTLRINQHPGGAPGRYRIEVNAADVPGFQPSGFSKFIEFALAPQDGELLRWYLEDYLQFDEDPAPAIAKRAEALMAERGEALFSSIFEASPQGFQLWALIEPHLSSARIEIAAGIAEATAIPWELMRNPQTKTNVALSAQAFVRAQQVAQLALTPKGAAKKVRILLVICRPAGAEDAPFRSVASRLVKGLSEGDRAAFQLDVLRPPTFEQLAKTLSFAREKGEPYHIVHFDGHGVYASPAAFKSADTVTSGDAAGARGFLVFEHPGSDTRCKFVDGFAIGALLKDAGVPILILNACQSAFASRAAPGPDTLDSPPEAARAEIEAYGSLGQAVMETGAAGVVAMRYSVYVVTAAQFVAELYAALARGRALGEAVSWARKHLANEPERRIAYEARPLQDWCVPVVWERAPLRLWPEKTEAAPLAITLTEGAAFDSGALDRALPERPDAGFFGRDETLYALDRAFDTNSIVLLHAYAGSGKTAAAAEFARWYALTGGVAGPVLFSNFERHLPLARLLDKIGAAFGVMLEASGIQWDAVTDDGARRDIALQILRQVPVLWIWDNIEPVTGFPAGAASEWSAAEQQELRSFLQAARDTKAKFLLTSRRDEEAWLGALPRRVEAEPMPMLESLQLAGAIFAGRGKRLSDLPDLTPLLHFARGNPLAILVSCGAALQADIGTKERLETFVASLRAGEAAFADEASEGRTKSLGASLSYGFSHAFSEEERGILALLHLFQGFVYVVALRTMGHSDAAWSLEALRPATWEQLAGLLDRAAELGLLRACGGGYYAIHPALPWYFRNLFERSYPADEAGRARRAFAGSMADIGVIYGSEYNNGRREVLSGLQAEEDNLLAAWRLARQGGWWREVIGVMQGLRVLYGETGRGAVWRRLVEAVAADFVDPATDGPRAGRAEQWSLVNDYRVGLALQERDLAKAQRLKRLGVDWNRQNAADALAAAPAARNERQRLAIRNLAAALHEFAEIQRERADPACVGAYREAFDLAGSIGHPHLQSVVAYNLCTAYMRTPGLIDLDHAEHWARATFDLAPQSDTLLSGQTLGLRGAIFYERFTHASAAKRPAPERAQLLLSAAKFYDQSLEILPETAIADRAIMHNQLGSISQDGGMFERAAQHYQMAIRYNEKIGDAFAAGESRYNVALMFLRASRFTDARAYAEASIANFKTFGPSGAAMILKARSLIADIDAAAAKRG